MTKEFLLSILQKTREGFMSEVKTKDEFIYKLVVAIAPPTGEELGLFTYVLDDFEYKKVKRQLELKQRMIGFTNDEGEPILISLQYPALYGTIEKTIKPKHIILPNGKGPMDLKLVN